MIVHSQKVLLIPIKKNFYALKKIFYAPLKFLPINIEGPGPEESRDTFDSSSSASIAPTKSEVRSRSKTEIVPKETLPSRVERIEDSRTASRSSSTSISIQSQKFNDDLLSRTKTPEEARMRDMVTSQVNMNIFEAVEMNRLDVVKEKLRMSPLDISKTDLSGRTLLILACEHGFEAIAKYLADNSDELVARDTPLGYFPAHMCAQFNRLECLRILYDVGASLQSKTNEGNTPLHLAAEQ